MFLTMVLISCHYLYNAAIIGRITTLRLSINNADPSTISHLFTTSTSSPSMSPRRTKSPWDSKWKR